MADWEPQYPPRTSSRFQAPGIFVNVEFGVSFSPTDRTHTASVNYTSRRMQERINRQQQVEYYRQQYPPILVPGNGHQNYQNSQNHDETRDYQQQRQRRLGVRTREQHERGSSAPPTLADRYQPISPINPISHIQHTSSFPRASTSTERPLPPEPSRFRLGEDNLPWSVPPWYRDPEPEFASPTMPRPRSTIGIETESRRLEDPQRVRDLGTLHQAMMTVDSLDHDGWETWTWDSVGDIPRGPRSLGWAVSTENSPDTSAPASLSPPPPPYVVSQWEQAFGRNGELRPRSSG
jgi:hypothetical protein